MPATIITLPDLPPPPTSPISSGQVIGASPTPKASIVNIPDDYQFNAPPVDPNAVTPKPKLKTTGIPGVAGSGLVEKLINQSPKEDYEQILQNLPMLGSITGSFAEPGIGTALGGAAGAFARQALTSNKPSGTQLGGDLLLNSVVPGGLEAGMAGKIASKIVNSNNPTVAGALASKAAEFTSPATQTLQEATASVPTYDIPSPIQVTKSGIKPRINPEAPSSVLDDYAAGKTPEQVAKKLVSDPREVEKLNLATGNPAATEQLALNHAVSQGYNDVSKTFDPDAILEELGGSNKEGYDAALQPGTSERLTNFLNTAKNLEPAKSNGMMSYIKHRLIFDAGAFGIGHAVAGGGLPGMAVGGTALLLSNQAVSRLMSSETLGNLALQSLKLAPDSPVAPIVSKTLINGLRGLDLTLQSKDGKTQQNVTVDNDGNLVPTK